jgi:uncharacterized protein YbaA (DUF1428 family)
MTKSKYIDGFIFPIKEKYLKEYSNVAEQVSEIWKEYGAIEYTESVADELSLEGTKSFTEIIDLGEDEVIVFGWVVFPSKEIRDDAHKKVPQDKRMEKLIAPIIDSERKIFDPSKMFFGGFKQLV